MGAKQSTQARNAILYFCSGLSVKEASDKAGITPATLYRWIEKNTILSKMLPMSKEERAEFLQKQDDSKARNSVNVAILSGKLNRPETCQKCGKPQTNGCAMEAHHPDYSQPMDVVWLCTSCHVQYHSMFPSIKKMKSAAVTK